MIDAKFQGRAKRPWRLLLVGLALAVGPMAEAAHAQAQPPASRSPPPRSR